MFLEALEASSFECFGMLRIIGNGPLEDRESMQKSQNRAVNLKA